MGRGRPLSEERRPVRSRSPHVRWAEEARIWKKRENVRTGVGWDLREPLRLRLAVLSVPPPAVDPVLLLLVPDLLVALRLGDALRLREALPLGHGFWFGERLRARELRRRGGELCEGAISGGLGGQGEEGAEEDLDAVARGGLEEVLEVLAVYDVSFAETAY